MKRCIITIGREYGTGGRNIGKRISELLGINYYDSELITMAAKQSGMSKHLLDNIDETAANSLMYSLSVGAAGYCGFVGGINMPLNDKLYLLQADIIRDIASRESAVIVGRCADHILRENEDTVNVFFYAPYEARKKTIAERKGISPDKAAAMIVKKEKQRKNYYNYYTGGKWGDKSNYHICIDTSVLGFEGTAELVVDYIKRK